LLHSGRQIYLTWITAIVIGLLPLSCLHAQKPTRVKLIRADDLKYDKKLGNKVQRLIGDVILQHDSTLLYADSAYLYELTNSFKGFGSVRIKASDTLNIYSDLLFYNGNTKTAELTDNVRLVDRRATLYTDHLWYDRNTKIAYYLTHGKIVDTANTLVSKKGYYYTDENKAYFKEDVVLINKKYTMETDTMLYYTDSEISYFLGPTTIISDENLIYCENGWYDTKTDKSQFNKNAYIITKEQKLEGDSLFFDRATNFGQAFYNVKLTDTVQNMMITGEFGEFHRQDGFAFVTDSATSIMLDKKDSLYMHADTLWIYFDSNEKVESIFAYYKSKFYRNDLQGMCDSLVYKFKDSTIYLYNAPVLWSDESQLTADSIRITLSKNKIDTLALMSSSFIISMDDTISRNTFNQIKGKTMVGHFKDNKMVKINIYGNAESVFYVREENGDLIGVNTTSSSDMNIYMNNNELSVITPINKVEAHMYPIGELPEEKRRLKNFKWIEGRRPMSKWDIYTW